MLLADGFHGDRSEKVALQWLLFDKLRRVVGLIYLIDAWCVGVGDTWMEVFPTMWWLWGMMLKVKLQQTQAVGL